MTTIDDGRLAEIRARLDAYPEPIGVTADGLDLFGSAPEVRVRLRYRPSDALPATSNPYSQFLAHAPADIADLLAEVDRLAAENAALRKVADDHHAARCCREHGTHSMPHKGCVLR